MGQAFNVNPQRDRAAFRVATARVAKFGARIATPDEIEEGKQWYPLVHEATGKGAAELGISPRHAAGIVAALSPAMEWEGKNIHALSEIGAMEPRHWSEIQRSHEEALLNRSRGRPYGRAPGVTDMIREVAPSIKQSPDNQLLKAHAMLHGADPDEVLYRNTAPKTNSFFHNIHDPDNDDRVTIDGRQADIIANRMRGWTDTSRGISSAGAKSGMPTRYEDHESVMRVAAKLAGRQNPALQHINAVQLQAVTWVAGKRVEREKAVSPSNPFPKQGPRRQGQPYL